MGLSMSQEDPLPEPGEPLSLRHFELCRCIGRGAFSKVHIVKRRTTEKLYALKIIDKVEAAREDNVRPVLEEYKLLKHIDHPFIVNAVFAFQDHTYLFFGLDLMDGGDLRYYFTKDGPIPENSVKFIVSEIVLALEYLHEHGICHRDVKPDNILLNAQGHAHLSDFNLAKVFQEPRQTSTSYCGTLHYMAPEIINRTEYRYSPDWWSLGVTVWELLTNTVPFCGKNDDEMAALLEQPFPKWPEKAPHVSEDAEDFICALLVFNINSRLGCMADGAAGAKNHSWLIGQDYDAILRKQIESPIRVDPEQLNFDPVHELEEMMADAPLVEHDSTRPAGRPVGFEFKQDDLICFADWVEFDKDDEYELALDRVTEGMEEEEAEIVKAKMRNMRVVNDSTIREMKARSKAIAQKA